ncbi:MAG: hypothetical protein PVH54_06645, partial [Gammaproteobacteria bacterium]
QCDDKGKWSDTDTGHGQAPRREWIDVLPIPAAHLVPDTLFKLNQQDRQPAPGDSREYCNTLGKCTRQYRNCSGMLRRRP